MREVTLGAALAFDRQPRAHHRRDGQRHERCCRGARDAAGTAVLADILAGDLIERFAVQPGGEHRDALLKARIGARYLLAGFGPAEVEPERLGLERAGKAAGEGVGRSPVEIACVLVPSDRAFGEHD